MDEDKYFEWVQSHHEELMVLFAEKYEDEFDEFCLDRYSSLGEPDWDSMYEEWRDSLREGEVKK